MRQAHIFYKDQLAGILTENDAGYEFCYLPEYLSLERAKAVSLTLPLQKEAYTSPVLFPFFDGLIPEGWLLDVALRNTDISILDRMSLLLTCCIGKSSIINKEKIFIPEHIAHYTIMVKPIVNCFQCSKSH